MPTLGDWIEHWDKILPAIWDAMLTDWLDWWTL